jgi:hypothetical protein
MLRLACQRLATVSSSKENWGHAYASAFDGMTLRAHDRETESIGPIIDPVHLQGLLERIASLGLTLHSLTRLGTENGEAATQPHTQPAGVSDPGTDLKGP